MAKQYSLVRFSFKIITLYIYKQFKVNPSLIYFITSVVIILGQGFESVKFYPLGVKFSKFLIIGLQT